MSNSPSLPDPYANIKLDPEVQALADTIQGRMSKWIDERVDKLSDDFARRAEAVSSTIVRQIQEQFNAMNDDTANRLNEALTKIGAIKLKFNDPPGLTDTLAQLEKAVRDHRDAVARQREQFQHYGAIAGELAKKMLLTAI